MTRTAKPNFDSFDPDVLEAARDVARRAGIPLEEWIARNVPQAGQRRRRGGEPPRAAKPGSDERRRRAGEPLPGSDGALSALFARLDGLDRSLADERRAADVAASRRLEEIEDRLARALDAGTGPVERVAERLGDIERRMSELGDKVASARPYPRRGRGAADMREAVDEIRQRQRALDEGRRPAGESNVVAGMRRDLARRLDAGLHEDLMIDTAAAVSELQRETLRLRESIGSLATSRDVGALEQAMISLATNVERARPSADIAAIAAPIETIRQHVERLAGEVADDVHARVADDVQRLAARLDSVAAAGDGTGPDGRALDSLFQELEEIRRLVGTLAGPERIQSLAQGMQAISGQIAQLQAAAKAESSATLRPLLEEIRSGLAAPAPAALVDEMRAMTAKLDALHERAERAGPVESRAILGRIDALADQVERASTRPVDDLIGRLEGLGETLGESLRRPPMAGGDVASIHAMLSNLAEKVERVGDRGGSDGLDALEKQVLTIAKRLDARGSDPMLASLERTMGDLLAQVGALREQAPDTGAIERAAREAVAASLGDRGTATDPGEIGLLRAGLADLQARQTASDQRLGAMLDGVQSALDRLMSRLDPAAEPGAAARGGLRQPSLEAQLMASTAADLRTEPARPRTEADRRRRPEAPRAAGPQLGDEPLEPGAARPPRDGRGRDLPEAGAIDPGPRARRDAAPEPDEGAGDIKTSFIAAARRAAQAAQAELATEAAAERRDLRRGGRIEALAAPVGGRLARLRAEIDRRRRPLLLGLAAVVLVLGALQAVSTHMSEEAPPPARIAAAQARPEAAPVAEAPREARTETRAEPARPDAPKPEARTEARTETRAEARTEKPGETAKSALADPQTTQSIATDPAPARPRAGPPRVGGVSALSGDLAGLPAGLAKLRQAALDGEGAAVWELAMRAADGRGITRDLALAAKLFEKLASAGYAPAQYKLGGHYEKGSGVTRDLAQAKLWYGRAAEQGHARSMHNLAVIYAESAGANGKPDYASAASWFRQGAEYGLRDSQYNLGVLYARGLGLGQDLVQSYVWFSAAAAQGDDDAGRKRDDVAGKLGPTDLANAKALAANVKPRRLDPAVNEPPPAQEGGGPMTLLGAPAPSAGAFTPPARSRGV